MPQRLRPGRLVPPGFVVDHVEMDADRVEVSVRSGAAGASRPSCGTVSRRLQSRYLWHVADLPLKGNRVEPTVAVRRFRCDAVLCGQQIFAERFPPAILPSFARRTGRLEQVVHHLGLALGGRPAAALAERLMLPVSRDTLLRVVRRRAQPRSDRLAVIGIDDFAWRRNQRYGTIICDIERRRAVTLLADREPATSAAWLEQHPSIEIVARDRGGGYGEAVGRSLPHATQVADRWHLMENASRAFLDAVRRSMRQIRAILGAATINPHLLTWAERLQYDGYLRREEANVEIRTLSDAGVPVKQICRRTGHSRGLVRQVFRGGHTDVFRVRQSSLEPYLPWLDAQWDSGLRNAAELWRRLKGHGFSGSLRVIGEWATRRRWAEKANSENLARLPSARTIARLMATGRDRLTRAETVTIAATEAAHQNSSRRARSSLCSTRC